MEDTKPQELYIRNGENIVEAPAEDVAVAQGYDDWKEKGKIVDNRRITIMTAKKKYGVGEEVRVIHAMEAVKQGDGVYIMGPKEVLEEYVDGNIAGNPLPEGRHPFIPVNYDGRVREGPWVDFNYDITVYFFKEPGTHKIVWQPGKWESNTLEIGVEESF